MVTLRTDIENLPLDGRHVLIGAVTGEVMISRFKEPTKHHPNGYWVNLSTSWPIAWLDIPEHPYFPTGARALASGEVAKP